MNVSKSYNFHEKQVQCISIRSLKIHGQRQNLVIFRLRDLISQKRNKFGDSVALWKTLDISYFYLLLYSDGIVISAATIRIPQYSKKKKKKERKNSTRTTLSANATCSIYAPKVLSLRSLAGNNVSTCIEPQPIRYFVSWKIAFVCRYSVLSASIGRKVEPGSYIMAVLCIEP